jgi:S-formylglutathione hydrolase FrmB
MGRWIALAGIAILALGGWLGARELRQSYTSTRGARVLRITLESRLLKRDLHETLVVPQARSDELVVFLHGRGSSPSKNLSQQLFDALHDLGDSAPSVLLADGGDHSYWHDRADGPWGTSLLREVIPDAVERTHAQRVAIGGISMGGFGALDLARLAPTSFCAVGAHSAALWLSGGETPAGAFDDAEDFVRHDVIANARARRVYSVPVWVDVGRDDPFYEANVALIAALRAHGTRVQAWLHGGGHGGWSSRMGRYLRFYASACS